MGCRSKALWRRRGKRKSSLSCMAPGMAHSWQPSRTAQSSFCGRRTRLMSIPPGSQGTWKPVGPLPVSKLYTVWWMEVASRLYDCASAVVCCLPSSPDDSSVFILLGHRRLCSSIFPRRAQVQLLPVGSLPQFEAAQPGAGAAAQRYALAQRCAPFGGG